MTRLFSALQRGVGSRALPPVILGIFFLLYIGLAFGSEDTLTMLMEVTRSSLILRALLSLLPLNCALRLFRETERFLARRRIAAGQTAEPAPDLWDETVPVSACAPLDEVQRRLEGGGYRTRRSGSALSASRGIDLFPVRVLFLAGTFCLFAGILISLTTRSSHRGTLIEGEPLRTAAGERGMVTRLALQPTSGIFMAKTLAIDVADSPAQGAARFGLYPPSQLDGAFLYPRYLTLGLLFAFSAPDLPGGVQQARILNIYPAGKEESVEIPDSPYRIGFSMAEPEPGNDPFVTGRMTIQFKVFKGKEPVLSGSAPLGGEFARDGYRVAIVDFKRAAITDFIRDYGVFLIWGAALFYLAAASCFFPIRYLAPRREICFVSGAHGALACSRSEGKERQHLGLFQEALDLIEGKGAGREPGEENGDEG